MEVLLETVVGLNVLEAIAEATLSAFQILMLMFLMHFVALKTSVLILMVQMFCVFQTVIKQTSPIMAQMEKAATLAKHGLLEAMFTGAGNWMKEPLMLMEPALMEISLELKA